MSYRTDWCGPCMCGATDCPSCGPAQGYEVVRKVMHGRLTWVNPEGDEEDDFDEVEGPDAERDGPLEGLDEEGNLI